MKFGDLDNMALSNMMNEDAEFIPLLTSEDEEQFELDGIPEPLSILPLRNTVLFPGVVIPITVGRDKSIKLIQDANKGSKIIGVVAQKDMAIEDPTVEHLYSTGTVAQIMKMLKMPDGSTTAIIQGKKRFELKEMVQYEPYFKAIVVPFSEIKPDEVDDEFDAVLGNIRDVALNIIEKSPHIPTEASFAIKNIESTSFLINFISSNLNIQVVEKQELLSIVNLKERAVRVLEHLNKEFQMLELKNKIQSKVKVDLDKQQREYFLHQQMKLIQEELGGGVSKEVEDLRVKAKDKKWPKKVEEVFEKEIAKLERVNQASPEYPLTLNYIETLIDLPWGEFTDDNFDLKNAISILDKEHFGLQKVKDRVLEHLAVLKLRKDMKSPIICLVGPPGVGKTSLGKSIAEALGRKYARISLGGLRDEAEIRGHRKTYIGAMPGRIVQNLKRVKSSNPVFILDEIDKVGNSFQGDPSSALLEVLDPEQNTTFYDNFLELEYDLSNVMFIATANSLSTIQPALRDRMEIIELSGYSIEEKIEIAKRHLIPKLIKENGLKVKQVKIAKKVIELIISDYTRESGVRNLERKLSSIIRNVAKAVAMDEEVPVIDAEFVLKVLGPSHPRDKYFGNEFAGVVTGLAWTSVGGDILFIETSLSKGKGKLTLTGNLGDVMKESALIALEYLRARSEQLNINPKIFDEYNVHIHIPEGATPKDGPSAGITIFTALASAFTQRKVRARLAMTGEITLRGQILPVGGIKEKILAAKRAEIKEIILCSQNKSDVEEIEEDYIKGLTFHYVERVDQLIEIALLKDKVSKALEFKID
jgi:ATP-dependent Lon protease